MKKNIVSRSRVVELVRKLRRQGKKIVFTNGVFDIIHRGHVEYLAKAKSFGDVLMVGLNSDASVKRLKGMSRPVQPQTDRAVILLALRWVDYVVFFGEDRPDKLIETVKPDVLVKGADYSLGEIAGASFVKAYGGQVKRVKLTRGRATSKILKRLG